MVIGRVPVATTQISPGETNVIDVKNQNLVPPVEVPAEIPVVTISAKAVAAVVVHHVVEIQISTTDVTKDRCGVVMTVETIGIAHIKAFRINKFFFAV